MSGRVRDKRPAQDTTANTLEDVRICLTPYYRLFVARTIRYDTSRCYSVHVHTFPLVAGMSRKLVTLVYERRIGSMMRKAVLAYMADRANDDGTGIWVSKKRIAREIEGSRSGVIVVIKGLVEDGILLDNGIINGRSTHDYTIDVRTLRNLPAANEDDKGCPDLDTPPVQKTTPPVYRVDTPCLPGGHEPSFNSPLKYGEQAEAKRLAEQTLSAMRAQGLSSPVGREVLASLTDLHKRGRVSLREIDAFKGAVRGCADGELVLSATYAPPAAISDILTPANEEPTSDH